MVTSTSRWLNIFLLQIQTSLPHKLHCIVLVLDFVAWRSTDGRWWFLLASWLQLGTCIPTLVWSVHGLNLISAPWVNDMSLKWRSVRVANELGAGSGKGARFAIVVSVTTSVAIGLVFWCLIIAYNDKIALLFSSSKVVLDAVSDLSVLLAFTVLLNSVQPVLSGKPKASLPQVSHCIHGWKFGEPWVIDSKLAPWCIGIAGVAIGSGWQALVAYVNVGSYYLVGVPIGAILGWPLHFGVGVMIRTHPSTFLLVCFGGEAVILFECMAMFGLILTVHTQIAGNLVRVDWWHSCSDTDISLSHYQLWLGWRGELLYFLQIYLVTKMDQHICLNISGVFACRQRKQVQGWKYGPAQNEATKYQQCVGEVSWTHKGGTSVGSRRTATSAQYKEANHQNRSRRREHFGRHSWCFTYRHIHVTLGCRQPVSEDARLPREHWRRVQRLA